MVENKVPFIQVPVTTVYIEQNRSTSFRAVRDSALIYWSILKFGLSSAVCAGIDLAAFAALAALVFDKSARGIMMSTLGARLCSGVCNFVFNKVFVFRSGGGAAGKGIKYLVLFVVIMFTSGALTGLLSQAGLPPVAAKVITDCCLFVLSYFAQRRFIFVM
jgi:putative flippase GtrA